jgi:hypothetical protein
MAMATVTRLAPVPATLTGPEIAARFEAGMYVLGVLQGVDGTGELLALIGRIAQPQQEAALFSSSCLMRLHGLELQLPTPTPSGGSKNATVPVLGRYVTHLEASQRTSKSGLASSRGVWLPLRPS